MKTNAVILSFLLSVFFSISLFGQPATRIKTSPAKSWVEKFDIDRQAIPEPGQESSFYYLLLDEQENIQEQEAYVHYAYKILTSAGVQQMSDLSVDFDPAYEQLIFHVIAVHRDGKRIDQLSSKNIRTIQREQSMDRYLYDGSFTAVINLSDVRVGDIVEYAFTRKGYNPVYDSYISRKIGLNYGAAYEKGIYRLLAPASLDLSFKYVNTDHRPQVAKRDGLTSYTWETQRVKGYISDEHEPEWYDPYSYVLITSFSNWAEMAAWCAKRYQVSDKDMKIVMEDIYPRFASSNPDEYALKVIRFVQDEIRYLGFESGLNSHKPHPPGEVYNQRFGDCKDKSLLLSTLLRAKGIESYPVLVNTSYGEKIADMLPSTNAFDHCVVQIKLRDRVLYVDPTINDQGGSLDEYYFPAYGKGLVVSASTTEMVDFPLPGHASTAEVQTFDIDSIGGAGVLTVQTTYTGSEAESQRSYFSRNSLESVMKHYTTYYANTFPDIEKLEDVQTQDDRAANIFVVKEKYKIPSFWKPYEDNGSKIYCEFYPQTLEPYFNVSKSTQRTAPYRLPFPLDYSHTTIINLPEAWNVASDHKTIETDYYLYDYDVQYENNRITLSHRYTTKKSSIPTGEFPTFVKDHGKMMSNLSYMVSYDPSQIKQSTTKIPGMVLSLISLAIGGGLAFWLYSGYDPKPYYPAAWGQPLGGWLILVAIGITITPIRLLVSFITEDFILSGQGWLSMWYAGNYGYFLMLFAEHIYNVVFFMFAFVVLVLFFQRRSSVPLLISIFYGASCVVTIADTLLALQIDPNGEVDRSEITRSIFGALIWIPYFQMSQRVKRTFVNIHRDEAEQMREPESK